MIWPFVPQAAFTETIEWLTDIIQCKASEQRLGLREYPRSFFEHSYHFTPKQLEAARTIIRNTGKDTVTFPLWWDATFIPQITASQTSVSIDTTKKRYLAGGNAFIIDAQGRHEIVEISSLNDTTLNFSSPYVVLGYTNAYIMPCHEAYFNGQLQAQKPAADYIIAKCSVALDTDFEITKTNLYSTFNSKPLIHQRPLAASSNDSEFQELLVFDNYSGPIAKSEKLEYSASSSILDWYPSSKEELWSLREFFYYMQGKRMSFYTLKWTRDFVVDEDITSTDTSIIFQLNENLIDTYLGPIAIVSVTGVITIATITAWAYYDVDQYEATLSGAIGVTINKVNIELVTRLMKCRFDSDAVTINYQNNSNIAIRLSIMEIP